MSTVTHESMKENNPEKKSFRKGLQPLSIRIKKAELNLIRRLKKKN